MSDYNKIRDFIREANFNALDTTPEEYLKAKIKAIEAEITVLKDEQHKETERLRIIDESVKNGDEAPKMRMEYFLYFKRKGKEITSARQEINRLKEAIKLVSYQNEIAKIQYWRTLNDYQIEYKAFKATSTPKEVVNKLIDDKINYRKAWGYHVLHTPAPAGIKPTDESIAEILEYIEAELKQVGDTSTEPDKGQSDTGQTSTDDKAKFDFDKELEAINKQEWKAIPLSIISDHFKVFKDHKSKNGRPYLSNEAFISFLKRGFLNDSEQPKQRINFAHGERGFLILRFYQFYVEATTNYSFPNPKKPFIQIVINCFENWSETQVKSYFKPGKAKEKW